MRKRKVCARSTASLLAPREALRMSCQMSVNFEATSWSEVRQLPQNSWAKKCQQ